MKLIKLLLSAIITVGLTSCLGDTKNTMTQDLSAYCLSYVTDNAGQEILSQGAGYRLITDINSGTMTVEITNLRLPNGIYINLTLPDQRYGVGDKGSTVINIPSYVSVANGISHTVNNFKMAYYSRYLGTQSYPMVVMSYNVDSMYDVRVVYQPGFYWGTTVVTDAATGTQFVNNKQTSYYGVMFDTETKKASIGCMAAQFAEGMPSLSMTFSGLDYSVNTYSYTVTGTDITPTISGTPYPSYKITDLRMTGVWGGNQEIEFTCTIDTEKVKGTYKVYATLGIIPEESN